jgi:hypothetical protein
MRIIAGVFIAAVGGRPKAEIAHIQKPAQSSDSQKIMSLERTGTVAGVAQAYRGGGDDDEHVPDETNLAVDDLKAAIDAVMPSAIRRPQTDSRSGCGMLA